MKRKRGEGHGRGGGAPIPHAGLPHGIRRAHDSAARHLGDALCLYESGRPQGAIPSAVLSIEESVKGICLAAARRRGRGASADEWRKLQDHKLKLQNAQRWVEEGLGWDCIVEASRLHISSASRPLFGARPVSKDGALAHMGDIYRATQGLQSIKKMASYDNWNAAHGAWDTFGHLPEGAQGALAVHVLHLASLYHDLLVHGAGGALGQPCAIACTGLGRVPGNPFVSASGGIILEAMLQTGTVAQQAYHVNRDIFLKCRRVALRHGDYHDAHPLVKAMSMAIRAHKEATDAKDGHYAYYADDSVQTYDGRATMFAFLIVSREGETLKLEKACINDEICDPHDSRIGAILETELAIDRLPGKEAPLSAYSEAFSSMGLKIRKLADEEICPALENARRMDENGQLACLPQGMVDSIRQATREGWDDLDPDVRVSIATMYVADPTVIVLSSHPDSVRKFKIRQAVWQTLCLQKAMHEGRAGPGGGP